ncbi:MAG: ATP-binding protein [Candidatus Dadabacteria bacterium]|nr:ATP-binding protein [Candidatus Dadabacteria bacterium]MYB26381.1 ATP-binding protein [Candidatus Dadabacteria bacterium]
MLYPRHIEPRLTEALEDSPVVLIHGPRQCGKTTLAQMVCAPMYLKQHGTDSRQSQTNAPRAIRTSGYHYIDFDDSTVSKTAKKDPMGFVAALPERVILDEVQRVPEIFSALKIQVDRKRTPGRFVMTGSANVLQIPKLSDSLAGRMQIIRLYPLSQCELEDQSCPRFLDTLFGDGFRIETTERLGTNLLERIAVGGYPAALARPSERRQIAWYRDYLHQLQTDILDFSRISMPDSLPQLLESCAAQTAGLFNLSSLASSFQLSRPAIGGYVRLLETSFLIERLLPWQNNRQSRLVKTPKLHIGDTGLACALLGVNAAGLEVDRPLLGQLLETFVFHELRRQAACRDDFMSFYHYRDRDRAEVDIVIERGTMEVAGLEVKASGTVTMADFRGLRRLRDAVGSRRFKGGVVLYDGEVSVGFGEGFYAVPLRMLWEKD